jgi:hypothetical protein
MSILNQYILNHAYPEGSMIERYSTEKIDEDISALHTMQGPITRARAQQLDLQVRSNLVNYFSELTLGSIHILLIRNNGEDQ